MDFGFRVEGLGFMGSPATPLYYLGFRVPLSRVQGL